MLKILLKKQFFELLHQMVHRNSSKKSKAGGSIALYIVLFGFVFLCLGISFFSIATIICEQLCSAGLDWLYFALMGIMTVFLGVVGSIFSTYSSLYRAKDNELLLAMPIPPSAILFARMATIYLTALMFSALVWIPSMLAYLFAVKVTASVLISNILLLFLLALFSTILSCILGWVVAVVSAHIKHTQIITVLVSIAFIAGYYYLYSKLFSYLGLIIVYSESIGEKIRTFLYPFYQLGLGAAGDFLSLLIFALILIAVFAVIYFILSKTFISLATTKKGSEKTKYKEQRSSASSLQTALLRKEFLRFTSSATYMLNSAMGSLLIIVGIAAAIIKSSALTELIASMPSGIEAILPLLICAFLAGISSMNVVSAPSVSLEGKTLWLVKSLPVPTHLILNAKIKLHLLISGVPTLAAAVTLSVITKMDILSGVLVLLVCSLSVLFCAVFGLFTNLKFPNFSWTSEAIAVKQGMSVFLAMFVPWGILILLGLAYYALHTLLSPTAFLIISAVFFALAAFLLYRFIRTKGVKLFESF